MSVHQFCLAAALVLLVVAALDTFFGWSDPPRRDLGTAAGWTGLAFFVAASLVP